MKRVVAQYKVKHERGELNTHLIHAMYEELESRKPDGLRYATLRLAGGVACIDIAEEPEDSSEDRRDWRYLADQPARRA